jgi:putative endonuclease
VKSDKRRSLGRLGESLAADYLGKKGYIILERNWHSPYGEIDLVTIRDSIISFIEVKTRSSTTLGPPEISVTLRKRRHMRESAEYYIQQHAQSVTEWHIDLITVQLEGENRTPIIDHFENVIE